ncbi:YafY family transcriptional regulator [Rhodobacter sp. NTK016B]|uniref:helix-turn-helix transcriptional regulator n=1 Tax=Rhodobacter sp. NTK016B TaxID=2759676 RepID=UPI001A8E7DE1|nr:YafY family protein [Rhodobacter sp. NTK016B]MBN8291344.1 YafY family transcriptional regulator [Rhodobacter sp. NTK016B]
MRSSDRLFQIIQILRRTPRPVTAAAIAEELEVSRRTVYRDITDLIGRRVPIQGTAGFGYTLDDDYEMRPLALTPDEAEALALGAQWVRRHPDQALARLALDALSKIRLSLPESSRTVLEQPALGVKPIATAPGATLNTTCLREAIRRWRVVTFSYRALDGTISLRHVWPILLGYEDTRCLLIAWCEERDALRHFRLERMSHIEVLERRPSKRRMDMMRQWRAQQGRAMGAGDRNV